MPDVSPIELRVELYSDGPLPTSVVDQVTKLLADRWPEVWDVTVPKHVALDHPAEWRAVVPLPDGATPESLHASVESAIAGIDPSGTLHYRTRWAFPESPNHQEIYEVRWNSKRA
jgi:hypothetical protein